MSNSGKGIQTLATRGQSDTNLFVGSMYLYVNTYVYMNIYTCVYVVCICICVCMRM